MRCDGRLLSSTMAFVFAVSGAAFAQIDPGRHMITGFAGGQIFDISDSLEDFGRELTNHMNLGVRYQYNLTDRWGVEGSFLFSPGNSRLASARVDVDLPTDEVVNVEDLESPLDEVGVNAYYYMGNIVFHVIDDRKWTPFLTAGAGALTLDIQDGGSSETRPAANFGGGFLYAPYRRIAVRLDVRDYVYTADEFDADSLERLGLPSDFDETIFDLSINAGISVLF